MVSGARYWAVTRIGQPFAQQVPALQLLGNFLDGRRICPIQAILESRIFPTANLTIAQDRVERCPEYVGRFFGPRLQRRQIADVNLETGVGHLPEYAATQRQYPNHAPGQHLSLRVVVVTEAKDLRSSGAHERFLNKSRPTRC